MPCQKRSGKKKEAAKWRMPGMGGESPINSHCCCIIHFQSYKISDIKSSLVYIHSDWYVILWCNIKDIVLNIVRIQAVPVYQYECEL